MRVVAAAIPDVLVIEPQVHRDARGFFLESFHARRYEEAGVRGPFVQDNQSLSAARTLRGLHMQIEDPQAKLVRVLEGEIYDVAVDLRRGSPTFGRWVATHLSADNFLQMYVPIGFAHGFCVLSERAHVEYKCTAFYNRAAEVGIAWNDPDLGIKWPVEFPVLSEKDAALPPLSQVLDRLPLYEALISRR